jgi:hypothetical protein
MIYHLPHPTAHPGYQCPVYPPISVDVSCFREYLGMPNRINPHHAQTGSTGIPSEWERLQLAAKRPFRRKWLQFLR